MLIVESLKITFEEIVETFKTEFALPVRSGMLTNKLKNRKLKFNETVIGFLTDIFFFLYLTIKLIP